MKQYKQLTIFSNLLRRSISASPGEGLRVFSQYKPLRGQTNILSRTTCCPPIINVPRQRIPIRAYKITSKSTATMQNAGVSNSQIQQTHKLYLSDKFFTAVQYDYGNNFFFRERPSRGVLQNLYYILCTVNKQYTSRQHAII